MLVQSEITKFFCWVNLSLCTTDKFHNNKINTEISFSKKYEKYLNNDNNSNLKHVIIMNNKKKKPY